MLPRKKIRFRWYDKQEKFVKETKITSIEGRFKESESLINVASHRDLLTMSCTDRLYGHLTPSLLVTYRRQYYSLDGVRLTFDQDIGYVNLRGSMYGKKFEPECVLELKASLNTPKEILNSMIGRSDSRFSKYCRGILHFIRYF